MNCSLTNQAGDPTFFPNYLAQSQASCLLYNATLTELARQQGQVPPVLNCLAYKGPPLPKGIALRCAGHE